MLVQRTLVHVLVRQTGSERSRVLLNLIVIFDPCAREGRDGLANLGVLYHVTEDAVDLRSPDQQLFDGVHIGKQVQGRVTSTMGGG